MYIYQVYLYSCYSLTGQVNDFAGFKCRRLFTSEKSDRTWHLGRPRLIRLIDSLRTCYDAISRLVLHGISVIV